MTHDPERQASYLRQSLSQGRRPLGLLLGAGCPGAIRAGDRPLIPDVAGLTAEIGEELSGNEGAETWAALLAQLPENSNIEAILSHIRALRAVAGDELVRGLAPDELETIENAICADIAKIAGKRLPDIGTPFHKVATWAGSSLRAYPVEIFTPNYDLLIEQALEETHVPYFDGFVGSIEPFFDLHAIEVDQLPPRWVRLWKIHGSINWKLGKGGAVHRGVVDVPADVRVIYPSHLKYEESRRMPYLALLDRLKSFIRQPAAVLFTSGFSFRDQHLNEVLLEGAEGNPSAMIFGLLHGELETYAQAIGLAERRANITILARDGGVVGTRRDAWPVVDAKPQTRDSIAVQWTDGNPPHTATFELGDFGVLGLLFADVSGMPLETQNQDAR